MVKLRPITPEELESREATERWMEEAAEAWGSPRWVWLPTPESDPKEYKSEIGDGCIWIYDRDPADAVLSLLRLTFEYKMDPWGWMKVEPILERDPLSFHEIASLFDDEEDLDVY